MCFNRLINQAQNANKQKHEQNYYISQNEFVIGTFSTFNHLQILPCISVCQSLFMIDQCIEST